MNKQTMTTHRGAQNFMGAASQKETLAYFTVRELHLELAVFAWKQNATKFLFLRNNIVGFITIITWNRKG